MDENEKRVFFQAAKEAGIEMVDITDQVFGGTPKAKTREEREAQIADVFGSLSLLVDGGQKVLDETLVKEGFREFSIDEIALLFSDEKEANEAALSFTISDTTNVFNIASDHVHTQPHETHYNVDYRFAQNGLFPWRVEVMSISSGFSPLHEAYQKKTSGYTEGEPVHVSWKCKDEEEYVEVMEHLHTHDDFLFAQSCTSTYGSFSYWRYIGDDVEHPELFLKPRFNRRDGV